MQAVSGGPSGPTPRRKQSIISAGSGNQLQPQGVANVGAGVGRRMSFADVSMNVARRMSVISMMRRMSR